MVHLLVDDFVTLVGLLFDEAAEPSQGLVANDKSGKNSSLAVGNDARLLILLVLGRVDLEDVVTALESLVEGKEDEASGLVVEVVSGLLDGGEALVNLVQGLVAKVVGLVDVRGDVIVGPLDPGEEVGGNGLVG